MNMSKALVIVLVTIILFVGMGCRNTKIGLTPSITVPHTGVIGTPIAMENADDIVPEMFGINYRANSNKNESSHIWLPIETVRVKLGTNIDQISVGYRNQISTKAGETRNNIIDVMRIVSENETWNFQNVEIYLANTPKDIEFYQYGAWPHLNTVATVLTLKISCGIEVRTYDFSIGLKLDGKDYGLFPCTITILQ
jgi:hypothetical protein